MSEIHNSVQSRSELKLTSPSETRINSSKRVIARMMGAISVDRLLLWSQKVWLRGNYIRAVNYHDTPEATLPVFERQIQFYAQHFAPVTLADLDAFFNTGRWHKAQPGLILSFDDGLRSNFDFARSVLERYGFVGWFFVPTEFVQVPVADQATYAADHRIRPQHSYSDGRYAMSWDELRVLAKTHVVGCHTMSHHRMLADDSDDLLYREIVESKRILEQQLSQEVNVFCWVGGEEYSYNSRAAQLIRSAGYCYSFMTNSAPIRHHTSPFHLQRTNIEANYPLDVVRFQLSGVVDVLYARKRKRVNRITGL